MKGETLMKHELSELWIRSIPADLKTREAHEDEGPIIEGYFSVFGDTYDMGPGLSESVDRHAFDETLADDVRALIDHDTRLVLGRTSAHTLDSRSMNTASGAASKSIRTTPTR